MQDRDHQIERARNARDLSCLGDPERWGGQASVSVLVPTGAPSNVLDFSPQIVRAQCADLISRAWELVCFWRTEGLDATDTYLLSLATTLGSGQVSGEGQIVVAPPLPIAPALSWWRYDATSGTIQITEPLPATAIAIRARLEVQGDGSVPAHTVRATCTVVMAPRALV